MAGPSESITLYGGRAERFREVKEFLEDERGWEPTNSEVAAYLLSEFDEDVSRR